MRALLTVGTVLVVGVLGVVGAGQAPKARLNPVIGLLEQKKPVFGLYAPSNRRFPGGGPPAPGTVTPGVQLPAKTPAELAREALGFARCDFLFNGSMEGGVDRGSAGFASS